MLRLLPNNAKESWWEGEVGRGAVNLGVTV